MVLHIAPYHPVFTTCRNHNKFQQYGQYRVDMSRYIWGESSTIIGGKLISPRSHLFRSQALCEFGVASGQGLAVPQIATPSQ